jgi:hypothetical protein
MTKCVCMHVCRYNRCEHLCVSLRMDLCVCVCVCLGQNLHASFQGMSSETACLCCFFWFFLSGTSSKLCASSSFCFFLKRGKGRKKVEELCHL